MASKQAQIRRLSELYISVFEEEPSGNQGLSVASS